MENLLELLTICLALATLILKEQIHNLKVGNKNLSSDLKFNSCFELLIERHYLLRAFSAHGCDLSFFLADYHSWVGKFHNLSGSAGVFLKYSQIAGHIVLKCITLRIDNIHGWISNYLIVLHSLGGKFSLMFTSMSKRLIKATPAFLILLSAFTFAFYIIHFGSEVLHICIFAVRIFCIIFTFAFYIILFGSEVVMWKTQSLYHPSSHHKLKGPTFGQLPKAFLKVFVMFHGEFEFDDFWRESKRWQKPAAQVFTMLLLVGLILFGSLFMVREVIIHQICLSLWWTLPHFQLNLIIAVLITDITQLQREADDQALVNQVEKVKKRNLIKGRMNFWKNSKRPLTPLPPHLWKIILQFFL